mmetsp:Transcript_67134/g.147166  ORF Transcript_67134/g.147166 Transcript_67134/m.147166 type:complete len:201 (-) Transcript_67134:839-1441(-)
MLRFDGHFLLAWKSFYSANDLGINSKGLGDVDDLRCCLLIGIEFQTVAHVEDLVHLFPWCTRVGLNYSEDRGRLHQVVLDHMNTIHKMQNLRLCPTRAMDHAMDLLTKASGKNLLHDGSVSSGGRQQQFACWDGAESFDFNGIFQSHLATVDQLFGHHRIKRFREFFGQGVLEGVMSGRREAVATNATIVALLIGGPPRR